MSYQIRGQCRSVPEEPWGCNPPLSSRVTSIINLPQSKGLLNHLFSHRLPSFLCRQNTFRLQVWASAAVKRKACYFLWLQWGDWVAAVMLDVCRMGNNFLCRVPSFIQLQSYSKGICAAKKRACHLAWKTGTPRKREGRSKCSLTSPSSWHRPNRVMNCGWARRIVRFITCKRWRRDETSTYCSVAKLTSVQFLKLILITYDLLVSGSK